MCDWGPGDKIVCIHDQHDWGILWPVVKGQVYTVERVYRDVPTIDRPDIPRQAGVDLVEMSAHERFTYPASAFRKVQRRDLSAWLETAATDTDRWDKPVKAPAPLHPAPSVDALFRRIMAGGDR